MVSKKVQSLVEALGNPGLTVTEAENGNLVIRGGGNWCEAPAPSMIKALLNLKDISPRNQQPRPDKVWSAVSVFRGLANAGLIPRGADFSDN